MGLIKNRRLQPCFGYFLQGAVKWICYINILQVFVGVVLIVRDKFEKWDDFQKEKIENRLAFTVRACIWASYWLHVVISSSLDIYLFQVSHSRNIRGLLVWIVGTFFSATWAGTVYYFHTYYFGFHVKTITIYNGYLIYRYYTCYVVYSYTKEIREDLNAIKSCRNLTDEEIQEFEDGLKTPDNFQLIEDPENQRYSSFNQPLLKSEVPIATRVQYERYKKEDYEIPMHQLNIDETQELGAGAYGKVYRGHLNCLNSSGSEESKLVAVKTINNENADVTLFKALLSELKIMSYLGKHEHVVSLLGACTAEIKFKKLYIVVEFCAFGSIYDYLSCNRGLFCSQVKDGQLVNESGGDGYSNFEGDGSISTKDLLKWCYQIADGMAYLERRKVIHSDLAARNVLLTFEKNVKITDFGLSRQLYQYAIYVKKQNTPLPWRWLAIESMIDMNFSSKSDVWSFGVTVWELFSMGEAPWPGEAFTLEFIKKLKNGMRMTIPTNCTDSIYNTLLHCWHEDPSTRPTFVALNEFFKSNYKYLN